jgi:K+-sensing histidine kinase KdpD
VRDYGPALPANVWKTLESSLGTSAQPMHSRPESSGLGIYIANQFAEAMHAEVGATRHRDGATFYVDLSASTQLRLF